ncbi:MAG: hypothetical protein JZU67_00355 [Burkholderiaceae bacterium]|nr:hypothetical protein [Burkholderiaceae bacterium]
MKFLKSLFQLPPVRVQAERELEEAQRELLAAESAAEYAKRIAEYQKDRIRRLSTFLNNANA